MIFGRSGLIVILLFLLSATGLPLQAERLFFRASILDFQNDPKATPALQSYRFFEDGLLVVEDGYVKAVGHFADLQSMVNHQTEVIDYRDRLIIPGFIDTHIHYPQTEMIASYGEQLLEWLETYTFPTEKKYQDQDYAKKMSEFFLDELLRNGTTTAMVFGTVHPESVEAFFETAEQRNLRMIAGKVLMDRNAPDDLLDTAQSGYEDSKRLIQKWHQRGRLLYAITPRFAPTSSPEQLQMAGKLKQEFPDVYVHTHLSENKNEIAWVQALFPERKDYLDVYDYYGLASSKSIFAHGVHLSDREMSVLESHQSTIAFCPTSNLFLGSGLLPLHELKERNIKVGMGTDVGAGTSFSMLETMNEAYKILQLQGQKFSAFEGFYQATLGGAKSLSLEDRVGSFKYGHEADFVVLRWSATPLQKLRYLHTKTLEEKLFLLMTLGDDRNIAATYVMGRKLFENN